MNKSLRLILLCPFVLLIKEIQWYCPQRCAYMEPNQSFQSLFSNSYSQIKIPFPHLYIRISSRIGRFIYIYHRKWKWGLVGHNHENGNIVENHIFVELNGSIFSYEPSNRVWLNCDCLVWLNWDFYCCWFNTGYVFTWNEG